MVNVFFDVEKVPLENSRSVILAFFDFGSSMKTHFCFCFCPPEGGEIGALMLAKRCFSKNMQFSMKEPTSICIANYNEIVCAPVAPPPPLGSRYFQMGPYPSFWHLAEEEQDFALAEYVLDSLDSEAAELIGALGV